MYFITYNFISYNSLESSVSAGNTVVCSGGSVWMQSCNVLFGISSQKLEAEESTRVNSPSLVKLHFKCCYIIATPY